MILKILFSLLVSVSLYQIFCTSTLILISAIALFIFQRRQRYQLFARYNIPGPKPALLDGTYKYMLKRDDNPTVYQEFRNKFGRTFGYFTGEIAFVQTSDLDILRQVFCEEIDVFTERSPVLVDIPVSTSILFAKQDRWKVTRKILSPSFNKFHSRNDKSSQFLEESIELLIEAIDRKMNDNDNILKRQQKVRVNIHDMLKSLSLRVVSKMAIRLPDLEVREDERTVLELESFLAKVDRGITTLGIMFPFLKKFLTFMANRFEFSLVMGRIHKAINTTIDNGLNKLKSGQKQEDSQIIDTMIRLHHEGKLSRREVLGNAEAILSAGYETTSTAMACILWALAKHQHVQERLRPELVAHGIDSKYLEQVIYETLRLYPAVLNFNRLTTRETKVKGYTFPETARVGFNAHMMHRDPEYWVEPLKFDPDRFSEGTSGFHPCVYAPFGFGARKCIAYKFAMLEMKMVVCDLLLRYKLHLVAPESLELKHWVFVLAKPKEKIVITFERLQAADLKNSSPTFGLDVSGL